MSLTEEQFAIQRQTELDRLRSANNILTKFVHGTADEVVMTANGPIPTLAALARDMGGLTTTITDGLTALTLAVDDIYDELQPPTP